MKRSLLLGIIVFVSPVVVAQSSTETRIAELERLVAELQQRVNTLEAQLQTSAPTTLPSVSTGDSTNVQNWRQLRMGMSEQEVESLLGSPDKVDVNQFTFTWYYGYPLGGRVGFDSSSRDVEGWSEP